MPSCGGRFPSGADVCTTSAVNAHFGAGADWHVWFGTKTSPIRVHVLFADAGGYLMVDGTGILAGFWDRLDKRFVVDIAGFGGYVEVHAGMSLEVGLRFSPFHVSGHYHGDYSGGAGVRAFGHDFGISIGGWVDFSVEAPDPIRVCGAVGVHIGMPNWVPDIDESVGLCI